MDSIDQQRYEKISKLYQTFKQELAELNESREQFKKTNESRSNKLRETHEEFKAEAAQAEKQIVFADADSVDDAKADMLMYDSKFQTSKLSTTYTNTLVGNDNKLDVIKSVLSASV